MSGYFELKSGHDGRYLFNLKAGNGEIILTSGIFDTKAAAATAIQSVKTNAPVDAQYERKIATSKEPYFVLKSESGEVLGRSEMYSSTSAMKHGMASVARNAPDAPVKDATLVEAK